MADVDKVGGKNASLGEMISHLSKLGVSVPGGFATTADAYRAQGWDVRPMPGHHSRYSHLATLEVEPDQPDAAHDRH